MEILSPQNNDKEFDYFLSLAFFILAGFSLLNILRAEDMLARLEIAASVPINLLAGAAFIVRKPALEMTSRGEYAIPLISFVMPFIVLNSVLLFPPEFFVPAALVLAALGAILSCTAIFHLRHSFAVLPAFRGVVSSGPYRFVRHPAYLGEMIYLLGSMLLAFSYVSLILLAIGVLFLVWRISLEERKLRRHREYEEYMSRVRFRLLPGIY